MKRKFLGGMLVLAFLSAWAGDDALAEALNNGADAKIVMRVVDQTGRPVSNACVKCGVWRSHANGGPVEVAMRTDGDGQCSVLARKCTGIITWSVGKDGFYESRGRMNLASDGGRGRSVSGDRWIPWGDVKKVTLKRQINPGKLCVAPNARYIGVRIPKFGEWLSFDLCKLDWLPPFGQGDCSDAIILCDKNVKHRIDDFSFVMTVSFTNCCHAGFYILKKDKDTTFSTAYRVDTNAVFKTAYEFSQKRTGSVKECHELGADEYIVFRTRTKTDGSGNLLSAHYGVISGPFRMGSIKIHIEDSCFNPVPNDLNIEDGRNVRREINKR